MRDRREDREEPAGGDQRAARAERLDRERREERPDPHGRDHDELEEPEDAADHALVHVLLHAREPRDVEEAVREPRQRQAQQGHRTFGPDPDQHERETPAGQGELERSAEPAAADEADAGERAEDAADAERGSEDADARFADPEELDRDDHEQHAERAPHERLRAEQPDQEPHRPVPRQLPRSLAQLAQHADPLGAGGPATVDGRMPATATNERKEAAAHAPKTAAGVDTARRRAAAAGPSNTAVDSNVSAATFEAASSRGVRASSGASARWQGRCAASGTAASTASA